MRRPTPQEYREAIQAPGFCFKDPDLKSATVINDHHGMPLVTSGRFASVYSLLVNNQRIAVRCFLQDVPDQASRYAEVIRALELADLPYTVRIEYLQQGILVNGQMHPILKMEWVEGISILDYITANVNSPARIRALADQWLQMNLRMQSSCISHGDFQHGNILVVNEKLKLVDYDGIYVPALDGLRSNELGHNNYQHPHRGPKHFGPYLDNFSAWVIYITLLALAEEPSLWTLRHGRDECILLNKSDYLAPEKSKIIQALKDSSNELVRSFAPLLCKLLEQEPEEIMRLRPLGQSLETQLIDDCFPMAPGASAEELEYGLRIWSQVWDPRGYGSNKRMEMMAKVRQQKVEEQCATSIPAGQPAGKAGPVMTRRTL